MEDPTIDRTSTDALRPDTWDAFVGQTKLKARLALSIEAAVEEHRWLDHILFCADPGYGKTTLAHLIAKRLGDPMVPLVMGPSVKPPMLAAILRNWDGGILFLDEIHRTPKAIQEDMLALLEDGFVQINGQRIDVPGLSVIGATTEAQNVIKPLWDRFPWTPQFEVYTDEEMAEIVSRMMHRLGVPYSEDACRALAPATGHTPRVAKSFAMAARDLRAVNQPHEPQHVLDFMGTDPDGLTDQHLSYLRALESLGGTVGLTPLCSMLRLHPNVVQDIERMLLEKELITFSKQGRQLLPAGHRKIAGSASATPNHRRT